jgi:hypothetical protein
MTGVMVMLKRKTNKRFARGVQNAVLLMVAAAFLILAKSPLARAADDEDKDQPGVSQNGIEKTHRRNYVGGRDEEELTVQSALPQPVRNPDAVPGAPSDGESSHD